MLIHLPSLVLKIEYTGYNLTFLDGPLIAYDALWLEWCIALSDFISVILGPHFFEFLGHTFNFLFLLHVSLLMITNVTNMPECVLFSYF